MPCNISNKPRKARSYDLTMPFFVLAMFLYTFYTTNAFALEPPTNIRLDGANLSWDEVPGANEYHLYYFDGPVPSSSVLGNYVTLTGGTSWPLDIFNEPFGYYTVVAVQVTTSSLGQPMLVECSKVTDGDIVAYLDTTDTPPVTPLNLATGQEQSFFPGDDGDKQAGGQMDAGQRYVVNGDGTLSDTLTQLVWIADSECIPLLDLVGALNYANELSGDATGSCTTLHDGSTLGDWRLANIVELQSLYNYGPLGVAIQDVPLTNLDVVRNQFWSSTSFGSAPSPNDIGRAWEIDFLPGPDTGSRIDQKLELGRAWAVRDN
jgi:hypothetical protein